MCRRDHRRRKHSMQAASGTVWTYVAHPWAFFRQVAPACSFNLALLLVVMCGASMAASCLIAGRMRDQRNRQRRMSKIGDAVGITLVFPSVIAVAAFVAWMLLGWLGQPQAMDRVYVLLTLAALPSLAWWCSYPLHELSFSFRRVCKAVTVPIVVWSTAMLMLVLPAGASTAWWRSAVATLPAMAGLAAAAVGIIRDPADRMTAAYPWKKAVGTRVVVFHPGELARADIAQIAAESGRLLGAAEELLVVEPMRVRLHIYLMRDEAMHRDLAQISGRVCSGYAHWDYITIQQGPWDAIKGTVAHEIGHILRQQAICPGLIGLVDEGLAEWTEARLTGEVEPSSPATLLPTRLHLLAIHSLFFDWQYSQQPPLSAARCYATARSLARYLIESHGIDNYKRLCKACYDQKQGSPGDALDKACQQVYKIPLAVLEQRWRTGMRPPESVVNASEGPKYDAWITGATMPWTNKKPKDPPAQGQLEL